MSDETSRAADEQPDDAVPTCTQEDFDAIWRKRLAEAEQQGPAHHAAQESAVQSDDNPRPSQLGVRIVGVDRVDELDPSVVNFLDTVENEEDAHPQLGVRVLLKAGDSAMRAERIALIELSPRKRRLPSREARLLFFKEHSGSFYESCDDQRSQSMGIARSEAAEEISAPAAQPAGDAEATELEQPVNDADVGYPNSSELAPPVQAKGPVVEKKKRKDRARLDRTREGLRTLVINEGYRPRRGSSHNISYRQLAHLLEKLKKGEDLPSAVKLNPTKSTEPGLSPGRLQKIIAQMEKEDGEFAAALHSPSRTKTGQHLETSVMTGSSPVT